MTTVRQLLDEKGENVITVGVDETVFNAIRKMADENVGSLIVCEGAKVVGIITERHYARNVFLEGRALPNTRVADVMETPVLFVRPELSAEECMAVMTYDLPLNFHPAAVRAWANVMPFGAVSEPA
jgi:CBS domain-containing protein